MEKTILAIMLTLLLTSVLTLAFNIQLLKAEWSGTVYIRADGSIDPPGAPVITYDNVTYTLTGNVTSNTDGIVVQRNNIIVDGAGYTLQGTYAEQSKGNRPNGKKQCNNQEYKNHDIRVWHLS